MYGIGRGRDKFMGWGLISTSVTSLFARKSCAGSPTHLLALISGGGAAEGGNIEIE